MDEDEDVVIEGSELHNHLLNNGYQDFELKSPTGASNDDIDEQISKIHQTTQSAAKRSSSGAGGRRLLSSTVWPDRSNKLLEVEIAQEILKSELLVSEDEDFINNFILSEDVLEQYKTECEGSSSYLGDVLMFSGSLAAVAGAVFFLSERTRAAAAAAAIFPSAVAAMSSIRIGAKVQSNSEAEQFKELLRHLICNMKTFKQLLRKSLNLIQGMEMMNQGYLLTAAHHNKAGPGAEGEEENKLTKALCKRSSFIELRRAIYSCTLQMIVVYRESVQLLMDLTPLEDHIDLKDHYLAFIDLENFGVMEEVPDHRLSVRQLKDTIQLSLLQQSEYLRRFSLNFCDKVWEDDCLNKSGVLKHVKDIIAKVRKITEKLAKVFEYHQALGLLPVPELEQRALTLRKQQSLDTVKKLLPLRNVYTSLFSTGLHLQNSLLKVRHLETFFDILEKYKSQQDSVSGLIPDDEKLLEWLTGFKEIQGELNACLACLDEGVGQIDNIKRPNSSRSLVSDDTWSDLSSVESVAGSSQDNKRVISESEEVSHMDEVFEAVIPRGDDRLHFEDDFVPETKSSSEKQQSKKVLKELKSVLKVKEKEFQVREAKALARQGRVESIQSGPSQTYDKQSRESVMSLSLSLGRSQETDSECESIRSDTRTIRSPDSDSGHHRQSLTSRSPDSDTGHHSDTTHHRQSTATRDELSSDSADSSDFSQKNEVMHCEKLPSMASLHSSLISSVGEIGKGLETRSFSSPDLKRFAGVEASSPYVSLEKLLDHEGDGVDHDGENQHSDEQDTDSSSSSSSSASPHKTNKVLFRRPMRPAALRNRARHQNNEARRTKYATQREENTLTGDDGSKDPWPGTEPSVPGTDPKSSWPGTESSHNGHSHGSSVYLKRNRDIGLPSQPLGFDSSLAAAAVAKSRQFFSSSTFGSSSANAEECFGSSESDSDQDLK